MLTMEDVLMLTSHNASLSSGEDYSPPSLEEVRIFLQLTQVEFAKKVGVSPTTINHWENGRSQPSAASRRLLEKKLKISPSMVYRMFPPYPPKLIRTASEAA